MAQDVPVEDFLAAIRADPDGFFQRNAVYWWGAPTSPSGWSEYSRPFEQRGGLRAPGVPRPLRFSVSRKDAPVEHYVSGWRGGWVGDGAAYEIMMDQGGDGWGYFLPWNTDFGYSSVLGPRADLFFNALMDGCSFGCVAGPNQTVKVSHHNIQNSFGDTDHHAMTDTLRTYGYDNTFARNDYRGADGGNGMGFVTGVRVNLTWRIYAQSVVSRSGGERIVACRRLM